MNLQDAKILVTGGSDGIGLETARSLKEAGARVAICGRDPERLGAAAHELGVVAIQADVGDEAAVVELVERAVGELGGYDALINNAAWGHVAPLLETDLQTFSALLTTNVTGAMLVARESAKHFVAQEHGTIINVGSVSGLRGVAGQTAYAASKFALRGMTQVWRAELRKHNVRVSYITPSEVVTDFSAKTGFPRSKSERKLHAEDVAHTIKSMLELNDRGFVTEVELWATNPD